MLVVFSGVDGSGKTTQALSLYALLRRRNIECKYIHFHLLATTFFYNVLSRKLSAKRSKPHTRARPDSQNTYRPYSTALESFWTMLMLLDNLVLYSLHVKLPEMLGGNHCVFICDRYLYDTVASRILHGLRWGLLTKIYLKLAPKPDLIFLFVLPGDLAHQRRPERPLSYYNQMKIIYSKLVHSLPSTAVTLFDTTGKREEIQRVIGEQVTKSLERSLR